MRIRRRTWHRIHKWLAVTVGVFILAWTISGVVMMLPGRWFGAAAVIPPAKIDYRQATLSPVEALDLLEAELQQGSEPAYVGLAQVGEVLAYEIYLADGASGLIDARSGDRIRITDSLASEIVESSVAGLGQNLEVEKLTSHDFLYPFGDLPIYRVRSTGDRADIYYVSPINGRVSHSTSLTRLRAAIVSVHTFEPMKLLVSQDRVRKGALVLAGGVGIGVALTGYLLALLPYFQGRAR